MKKTTKQITKMGKLLMVFGVFFSQLSFPLGVLADEHNTNEENNQEEVKENIEKNQSTQEEEPLAPTDPEELPSEEETNYQVFINDEEVTEYTITEEDSKIVNITQNYQGEEEYIFDNSIESIDFTNKLYGTYTYEFNVLVANEIVASKTITIHYLGDNSTILNEYMNTSVSYKEGTYVVLGNPLNTMTVQAVLEQFNVVKLETDYQATLTIRNDQDEELEELDPVISNYKLILKNDQVEQEYTMEIVGDYNLDGLVDETDKFDMIDGILLEEETNNITDTNYDGIFNILDATHPVFTEKSWENTIEAQDELSNTLQNKDEIYMDEELEVKYSINGFTKDTLKGIEGTLSYDHELLELVDITIEHVYGNINESGKFVYLLEDYSSNDVLMTLKFKALASGNTEIAINDIVASLGGVEANLEINLISTEVTILEYGIGGDQEPEEDDTDNSETESTSETNAEETTVPAEVTQTVATTSNTKTTYRYVALSSNNDIESLTIDGYDIEFNKDTLEYSIKVKNSVKSLGLNITLSDANATYVVEGNSKFKVGENTVTIVVTAENGDTKTYTIKVTREKATEEEVEEEETESSSSSKTVIIILIILVIIGLIYVIFKDDEEENEKENNKTKKGNKK